MGWTVRSRGENLYHHVYAWGNDRHAVFKEDKHYHYYLRLLDKCSVIHGVDIIAYALMEWHVHLFIYDNLNKISEFMMDLHGTYAQYFNYQAKRVGHVFGERFNNKIVLKNIYGIWLSRYIHRQAVETGIVVDPKDYPWTSYLVYLGMKKSKSIKPDVVLNQFGEDREGIRRYESFVLSDNDGPIDWGKRIIKMRSGRELVRIISKELGVEPALLTNPRSWRERALRKQAVILLIKQYGFKAVEVAQLLHLSRPAVTKALHDNTNNIMHSHKI